MLQINHASLPGYRASTGPDFVRTDALDGGEEAAMDDVDHGQGQLVAHPFTHSSHSTSQGSIHTRIAMEKAGLAKIRLFNTKPIRGFGFYFDF